MFRKENENTLNHHDALIALQSSVLSKRVKKTMFYDEIEEMSGKDVSVSLLNGNDTVSGIMFNLKQANALSDCSLERIQKINGIRKVEKGTYTVCSEDNSSLVPVHYVEVTFDDNYPTTLFNMRRVGGLIDIALA